MKNKALFYKILKFYKNKYKNINKQQKINCIFFTTSTRIKRYIFISINLLILDIRKLEVPTMTATLKILIPKYNMIMTYIIVGDS